MTDIYSKLLSWHAAHIRSLGHIEFGATILRTRSRALHDVLAYVATDEKHTVAQLKERISDGTFHQIEFRNLWLATLGRVITIQALDEEDSKKASDELEFGMTCLKHANSHLPRIREHQQFHRLEIEILATSALIDEARKLLKANEFLSSLFYGYLDSDLNNPVISRSQDTFESWLKGFNRPFVENGLLPIQLASSYEPKFNDLDTEPSVKQRGGPKVSVLLTSFKPDRADFLLAVKSILQQSWENLELIIVDDASPSEFNALLTEAEDLDSRVRIIKLEENGGTYRARNAGIDVATGAFITGQDSDDWSHPERIAAQVEYLIENPTVPGVIVEAIRADEALIRTFPGRIPYGPCEVSFMVRAELGREVGGYLSARKGADGEFRRRVETYTGKKVETLEKPLYLIRIGHDSLSRADFKPGWAHPVRRAFWNISRYWHENTPSSQLRLPIGGGDIIPIPDRFKITPPSRAPKYDVLYVGDWRAYTSTQRAMIDEIVALRSEGKSVGILHLESILSPSKATSRLCYQIQALINSGEVSMVSPDEGASTRAAVLHDPTILQFASLEGVDLNANLLLIKPDMPPPAAMTAETMYLPEDCEKIARQIFGCQVVWTSNDPEILQRLASYESNLEVYNSLFPVAFQPNDWIHSRKYLVQNSPQVGRHSANFEAQWPRDLTTAQTLWPPDGSVEVGIMGDPRSYLRKYSVPRVPLSWVAFREGEIEPRAFMSSLDFFIYFPDEGYSQAFCREGLEAAAAGAIVILPRRFREAHGDSALYLEPREVFETVKYLWDNPGAYSERVRAGRSFMREVYSNDSFIKCLEELVNYYNSSPTQHGAK